MNDHCTQCPKAQKAKVVNQLLAGPRPGCVRAHMWKVYSLQECEVVEKAVSGARKVDPRHKHHPKGSRKSLKSLWQWSCMVILACQEVHFNDSIENTWCQKNIIIINFSNQVQWRSKVNRHQDKEQQLKVSLRGTPQTRKQSKEEKHQGWFSNAAAIQHSLTIRQMN